jgi:superfamily II DNA or RNA helicase
MPKYNYNDHINSITKNILNNKDHLNDLSSQYSNSDTDSDLESNIDSDSIQDSDKNLTTNNVIELNDTESDIEDDNDDNDDNNYVPPDDIIKIMKINYSYPSQDDNNFQNKIYQKREFYYHKIPPRQILTDYQDIKKFRDMSCGGNFRLRSQQSLLANFINPDTPFRGILIYHGVGTGKTCSAVAIAENFKEQVKKYGTKIHILVSGPVIKENWRDEIIKCTKETYYKDITLNAGYVDEQERQKQMKQAKILAQQYYKIMSYRSFYKKVLGQKISDKQFDENKIKKTYRRTSEGDFERDIAIDKLDNLNNTLLIIDEAHNITGNEYGNALRKIIDNSKNLKIILLSATPMINFADEIIELLNYIRPNYDPIYRDMVFTSDKSHLMAYKSGGRDYLQKMSSGYISHFRGLNPLTFAENVDIGEIPDELFFTKLFRCPMLNFQTDTYINILGTQDDSLDRRSQAVSNFCFPGLDNDKKNIVGYFGKEGMNIVRSQLKASKSILQRMINEKFFNNKLDPNEIIKESDKNKSITGLILVKDNIKYFSIKFYNALLNLENLTSLKNGAGTAFFYFNLVKVGIDLFTEVLQINGYLEYNEDSNYNISDITIDAITGLTFKEFKNERPKEHFFPATYITMTGKNEENLDQVPEIKKRILDNVFNHVSNKDGRYIKLVLGSKVMNEGITLENVAEVHIMDVYYNLGKVHQVIGRALRECKHYKITNDENRFPKVNIYRYVVSLEGGTELTTEELMYQKAEQKYFLIKDTERALKEVAFDCPINYHGNIFPEEIRDYKDCVTAEELIKMNPKERKDVKICPQQCDFKKCTFKCYDDKLNLKYYDSGKRIYRRIAKDKLDYSTFTNVLARNEINFAKDKIKELYRFRYVYTLSECVSKIRKSYTGEKRDLFEDFFVFKALDELIPITENDFNNYADTIYDKFNVPGYLIYRDKYYIFQPFEQNEDVPMYYRSTYNSELFNDLSLYTYLKSTNIISLINHESDEVEIDEDNRHKKSIKRNVYNFKNVIEYYDSKPEYDYVGIIDKASLRKRAIDETIPDTFKLRSKRSKFLKKKRGTGIPSLTGAVCETSKKKEELIKVAKYLGIKLDKLVDDKDSRIGVCQLIRHRLLYLEKYSTTKDKNKFTYLIIPDNHPKYKFPLNLEDHIQHIIKQIENKVPFKFDYKIEKEMNGIFEDKRDKTLPKYIIKINNSTDFVKYENFMKSLGFKLNNNKYWELTIE